MSWATSWQLVTASCALAWVRPALAIASSFAMPSVLPAAGWAQRWRTCISFGPLHMVRMTRITSECIWREQRQWRATCIEYFCGKISPCDSPVRSGKWLLAILTGCISDRLAVAAEWATILGMMLCATFFKYNCIVYKHRGFSGPHSAA